MSSTTPATSLTSWCAVRTMRLNGSVDASAQAIPYVHLDDGEQMDAPARPLRTDRHGMDREPKPDAASYGNSQTQCSKRTRTCYMGTYGRRAAGAAHDFRVF